MKLEYVCTECGSYIPSITGVVEWDIEDQEFTIVDVPLDGQYCEVCDAMGCIEPVGVES